MVVWGANTVHTYGSSAPAAPSTPIFGSSAPTPSTGFGAPAPSAGFGAPAPSTGFGAPAPSTGFGSPAPGGFGAPAPGGFGAPFGAPSPGGSLFGPSPAPSTSLFGSSPAPSGGLFGSAPSSSSLFGGAPSSGGLFGAPAPPQQQQQGPQIPAQAALQAHMDASARQEEQRVTSALEKIHRSYQGTDAATTSNKSAAFTSVVYDPATPQIRQQQWLHGMGLDGQPQPIAPPRPAQFCEDDWHQAVLRNPDKQNYMPVPLVGAAALMARTTAQQNQVASSLDRLQTLEDTQKWVEERHQQTAAQLEEADRRRALLSRKLLDVMRKVEIVRCLNHPLQPAEIEAMTRLQNMAAQLEHLRKGLDRLAVPAARVLQVTDIPDDESLRQALTEQRTALSNLTCALQRDKRDVELIHQRVRATTRVPVPRVTGAMP